MSRSSTRTLAFAVVAAVAFALTGCAGGGGDATADLKSDHADNQGQLTIVLAKDDSVTKDAEKVGQMVPSVGAKWTLTNKGDKPATAIYAVQVGGPLPDKELDESKLPGGKADTLDHSSGSTIKPGESVSGYVVVPLGSDKLRVVAGIETGGGYEGSIDPKGTPFEKK